MGYASIKNLFAVPGFVGSTDEVYCLEKVDGTSSHISWKNGQLTFFSGGSKHETFVALFDQVKLTEQFKHLGGDWTIYGEAYGGKLQGMRDTYGDALKFVAFDVLKGERGKDGDGEWLNVPDACVIACSLSLEFVHFERGPNTLEFMDKCRDMTSVQAKRNGIDGDKVAEGVVLKPITEQRDHRGNRVHYKHKRKEWSETRTPREVDPAQTKVLESARAVADEYVVPERLKHVIGHLEARLQREVDIKDTGDIIREMIADIKKESMPGEIDFTQEAHRAIGTKAAQLFKKSFTDKLNAVGDTTVGGVS